MTEQKQTGYPSVDKPWLEFYDERAQNAALPACSMYEYLCEKSKNNRSDVALAYYGKKTTYGELISRIGQTARALAALGIEKGSYVTLALPALPETIYLIYALNKLGAVVNSIDPRTNVSRMSQFISDVDSTVVFAVDAYLEPTCQAALGANVNQVVLVSPKQSLPAPMKLLYTLAQAKKPKSDTGSANVISWHNFLKRGKGHPETTAVSGVQDAPAVVVYTSGTTGVSKGAVFSNHALCAQAFNMAEALFDGKQGRGSRFLNIMPPWLAYGMACGIHSILCIGMQETLIPKFDYKTFDRLIIKHKPEYLLAVPSFFENVLESPLLQGADLSFLKAIIIGGAPMNHGSEEKMNEFLARHNAGIRITKGYGMTEMCAVMTYSSLPACNAIGSVGIPLVKNNVAIVDLDSGEELPYGQVGEVYLTGPTMMVEYLNHPEETEAIKTQRQGKTWIKTGDLGFVNANGELFLTGRIKQTITFEGHNIFPSVIENVLSQHPLVKNVAVLGIKYEWSKSDDIPTAFVVLSDLGMPEGNAIAELKAFSLKNLPQRDVAQKYVIVDSIPLTANGKVDAKKLEEIAKA